MTTHGKRAETIEDAAFVHTAVFTQPVWSWPEELAECVPSFDELYVDGRPAEEGTPDPLRELRDRIERTLGPVKLLLTGQKGSGKSWALKRVGEALTAKFNVVTVSATDTGGDTLPDADVQDLLILIAAELTKRVEGMPVDTEGAERLATWAAQTSEATGMELAAEGGLYAWVRKLATRIRTDDRTRLAARKVPADEMAEVVRALLKVLRASSKQEVLVLFDDLDKIDLESARRVFLTQSTVLSTLHCRMVLTFPFSLNFEGIFQQSIGRQTPVVLRNVKVSVHGTNQVPSRALEFFRGLLARIIDPALVDDEALREMIQLSAGVPREFGLILQRACLQGHYADKTRLDDDCIGLARRGLLIDMQRATQDDQIRDALCAVRRTRQLGNEHERVLLDRNLVVEYVNGEPWYDVHPILEQAVDGWLKAKG